MPCGVFQHVRRQENSHNDERSSQREAELMEATVCCQTLSSPYVRRRGLVLLCYCDQLTWSCDSYPCALSSSSLLSVWLTQAFLMNLSLWSIFPKRKEVVIAVRTAGSGVITGFTPELWWWQSHLFMTVFAVDLSSCQGYIFICKKWLRPCVGVSSCCVTTVQQWSCRLNNRWIVGALLVAVADCVSSMLTDTHPSCCSLAADRRQQICRVSAPAPSVFPTS